MEISSMHKREIEAIVQRALGQGLLLYISFHYMGSSNGVDLVLEYQYWNI